MTKDEITKEGTPLSPKNGEGVGAQGGGTSVAAPAPTTMDANTIGDLSNQERFMQNIRAKYGSELSDEDLYAQLMSDYDKEHEYNKAAREDEAKLRNAIGGDEDFGRMLQDLGETGDMAYAMRNMPSDVANYRGENVEARQKLLEEERVQREDLMAELEQQQANLDKSQEVLKQYVKDNNLSPEEAEELMSSFVNEVIDPITKGIITPETVEAWHKGKRSEELMAAAREAGYKAAQNSKISEQRKRFDHGFDKLPTGGSSSKIETKGKEDDPMVSWVQSMQSRRQPIIKR